MKFDYKKIHIGRRTLKTAAAVISSIVLVSIYGVSASKMTFAMLGAMNAMENSFKRSLENCLTQIVGMLCGAVVGLVLHQLPIHWLLCIGIGIVLAITVYNIFRIPYSPVLPCLIILTVCTTSDLQPFAYAIERLWDTAIGLGVGLFINVLVLPYDNSFKIRNSIVYLKEEVIVFLEDMFDGDTNYPNTEKMTKTITEMAGQLGILSKQWFPIGEKQIKQRRLVLMECEGKARQMLAEMEVLSRMKAAGRLTEDTRRLLEENGVVIRNQQNMDDRQDGASSVNAKDYVHTTDCVQQVDIVTNYHVTQILKLRQELIDTLVRFPIKRRLKNVTPIYESSNKMVYTALSDEFGDVVLKTDTNMDQLRMEYEMMVKLRGKSCCKVYALNEEKGYIIEERILPGNKLREEASLEKRIDTFVQVFSAIHAPVSVCEAKRIEEEVEKLNSIPAYLDWLENICKFCKERLNNAGDFSEWNDRALRAREICLELFEKYPDRVLLHGDLHHDNMLKREDGSYAMIDPKGVIGPVIFDTPRFILNEFDTEYDEDEIEHIQVSIEMVSKRLNYPVEDLQKLFYMETVLANVWSIEDGEEVNMELMHIAETLLPEN